MNVEILGASAPAWANEEGTAIDLMVRLSHIPGEVLPFTATPDAQEDYARELYFRAKSVEFGPIGKYTGVTNAELDAQLFEHNKDQLVKKVEAEIAMLGRAKRLKMATQDEERLLEKLERFSVVLMRAMGPDLPVMES